MRTTRSAFSFAVLLSTLSSPMWVPAARAEWTQIAPTVTPEARDGAVVVYDPVRKAMVVFGGNATDISDETWLLHGDVWTKRSPAHSPPARSNAYAYWDGKREKVVMFGGNAPGQIDRSVIWTWDGNDWSSFTPAANPNARRDAAVAYDSTRDRVVLFGGVVDGSPDTTLADTWEFDGSTWTETTPTASPGDRGAALMGYDPSRQIIVLVNGYSEAASALRRDTWIYADGTWTEATSAGAPQGSSFEMIWHPTLQKLMIVGRKETGTLASWTFDGSMWSEHATSTLSLNGIPEASLAFDSEQGVAVYLREEGQSYRGYQLGQASWEQFLPVPQPGAADVGRGALVFDTRTNEPRLFREESGDYQGWRWDGTMWRLMTLDGANGPSFTARVAYDPGRGVTVAFDGRTVELAGTTWTNKTSASAPVSSGAMAFDKGRGRIVYFGGSVAFAQYTDATWSWDGTTWEPLTLTASPTARRQAAMAYDEGRQRMVLFGGLGIVDNLQRHLFDTWEWSGETWKQTAMGAVELRDYPSMAYDQGRKRVVLWGAQRDDESKLWEYDGTTWIGTEPPPIAGITGIIGYDAAGQRLLLHDGNGNTWARPSGTAPDAPNEGTDPLPPGSSSGGSESSDGNGSGDGDADGSASNDDGAKPSRGDGDSGCTAAPHSPSKAGLWMWLTALAAVRATRKRRQSR